MLILERTGFGMCNKRHIVIDYGYVFTLTLDGDVCDPNGIYVSLAKRKLNVEFIEPDILSATGEPASYLSNRFIVSTKDEVAKVIDSNLIFTL